MQRADEFPLAPVLGEPQQFSAGTHFNPVQLAVIELEQRFFAQVERRGVERRFPICGNEDDALFVAAHGEDVAAHRRLLADEQVAVILVAGRSEADVDSWLGQAVVLEIGRLLVDDAHEANRRKTTRDGGDFRLVGGGGDGIDDLPAAIGLLERRRFARFGSDAKPFEQLGFDRREDLFFLRHEWARLLRDIETDVREQTGENHDENNRRPQTTHLPSPPGARPRLPRPTTSAVAYGIAIARASTSVERDREEIRGSGEDFVGASEDEFEGEDVDDEHESVDEE